MMNMETAMWSWGVACAAALAALVVESRLRHVPVWFSCWLGLGGMTYGALANGLSGVADRAFAVGLLALPCAQLLRSSKEGFGTRFLLAALGTWLGWKSGLVALGSVWLVELASVVGASLLQPMQVSAMRAVTSASRPIVQVLGGGLRNFVSEADNTSRAPGLPAGVVIFVGLCLAAGVILSLPSIGLTVA